MPKVDYSRRLVGAHGHGVSKGARDAGSVAGDEVRYKWHMPMGGPVVFRLDWLRQPLVVSWVSELMIGRQLDVASYDTFYSSDPEYAARCRGGGP